MDILTFLNDYNKILNQNAVNKKKYNNSKNIHKCNQVISEILRKKEYYKKNTTSL